VVEKIEPVAVVNTLIANAVRQKLIDQSAEGEGKGEILEGVRVARDYARESIEEGLTGN
jgi:hypothetical protein